MKGLPRNLLRPQILALVWRQGLCANLPGPAWGQQAGRVCVRLSGGCDWVWGGGLEQSQLSRPLPSQLNKTAP